MGLNKFSDYGSGSSSESCSPWDLQETWEDFRSRLQEKASVGVPRSSSLADVAANSKLEANMQEFRMNGFDSPYDPDDDRPPRDTPFVGLGPASAYLRQKSWPSPEVTPTMALPRADWSPPPAREAYQKPLEDIDIPDPIPQQLDSWNTITEEQMLVLKSLPNGILYSLLRQLEQNREQEYTNLKKQDQTECRFCKNNGERASFYRSHALRHRGRVCCPVLRAFVCRRCGASGDRAHTLKYCPLATADERRQSTAIMQSVRMASGKRRHLPAVELIDDYMVLSPYSTNSPHSPHSTHSTHSTPSIRDCAPLDPIWEALERKLML